VPRKKKGISTANAAAAIAKNGAQSSEFCGEFSDGGLPRVSLS
jgi:hypothetical protein